MLIILVYLEWLDDGKMYGNITEFSWKDWPQVRRIPVNIVGVPAEAWAGNFANRKQTRYPLELTSCVLSYTMTSDNDTVSSFCSRF